MHIRSNLRRERERERVCCRSVWSEWVVSTWRSPLLLLCWTISVRFFIERRTSQSLDSRVIPRPRLCRRSYRIDNFPRDFDPPLPLPIPSVSLSRSLFPFSTIGGGNGQLVARWVSHSFTALMGDGRRDGGRGRADADGRPSRSDHRRSDPFQSRRSVGLRL